ncbi:DUF1127 domain-containing protein [Methylobacterium sp. 77]|uniref:DUF1127 domain-containing protein n=1 Tax=Methylobacterium sp. 77 TaxID=1101192 RepID=UPI00037D4D33|nr:DUF1127 domain-containing protein [Methylobacterium sp. 77]
MTTIVQQHRRATRIPEIVKRLSLAVGRLLTEAAEGVSRQAINRRVVRKLSVMTDRELKDIGLIRQDVMDAVTSADDASELLMVRRDERRGARRIKIP